MPDYTDEAYDALDEYYTQNPPKATEAGCFPDFGKG
jgi:hypothetical protein